VARTIGRVGRTHIKREHLKLLISCSAAILERNGTRPTISSMSKYLRYTPSPHFRGIVNELVTEGKLLRYEEVHWNGKKAYVYLIPKTPFELLVEKANNERQ